MKLDVPESMPVCAEVSKWFLILSPRGLCDMIQGRAQPQGGAVGVFAHMADVGNHS